MHLHQKDKRDRQSRNNADYVASLKTRASHKAVSFLPKVAAEVKSGKSLRGPTDQQFLKKDPSTLSKEQQYHYVLILSDFRPDDVEGYDEFKPGGFRYNHSKAYNYKVLQALGHSDMVRARQMGDYWADPTTTAGNVMINHHQRQSSPMHIINGNTYKPSKETINQQNAEHLGEEGVKKMAIDQLQYCQGIRKAIAIKINDPSISEKEKNNYLAKDAKLSLAVNQLLGHIGELTKQQSPKVEKAGYAIPIVWAINSLATAILVGTALYGLSGILYGFVHETLEDVVDSAIDDLLRDTGVGRPKSKDDLEPKPLPGKAPKATPAMNEQKEDDNKPLKWDAKPKIAKVMASKGIQGGLDEKKTKAKRSPKQYEWHAHHPWPKFIGGLEEQPKMGVRSYVHLSLVHPMLTAFLKAKGYDILVNQGPKHPKNDAFVKKMIANPIFKLEVMRELKKFYLGLNSLSNPATPPKAYSLGLEHTFKNLK